MVTICYLTDPISSNSRAAYGGKKVWLRLKGISLNGFRGYTVQPNYRPNVQPQRAVDSEQNWVGHGRYVIYDSIASSHARTPPSECVYIMHAHHAHAIPFIVLSVKS